MEDVGAAMNYSYLDEMWSDEADFMVANSSTLWVADETGLMMCESSLDFPFPTHDHDGISNHNHHAVMTGMDHAMGSRDHVGDESNKSMCEDVVVHVESKKRSRIHGDIPVPRNRRGGVKVSKVDDDINALVVNIHNRNSSSSSCCSEDADSMSCSGSTRAGRGSATDPQSLYARKRRERINERLKILQKLVPNGTKVDISTMLEEAVHYVKFLQLQIKLLSSDDLWMYAPIAHNGMDLGALDFKISSPDQH